MKTKLYPKEPRKPRRVRNFELVLNSGGVLCLPGSTYTESAARECLAILNEIERCYKVGDKLEPRWEAMIAARPDFKERLVKKGLVEIKEGHARRTSSALLRREKAGVEGVDATNGRRYF